MSEEKARAILRETAGPFSRRSVRTPLPREMRLGRRVTGPNAHEAMLRFAIEITIREAVCLTPMFNTNAEHGVADLVRYVPTPPRSSIPDRVQMTIMISYANGLSEPIIAVVTHDAQGQVVVDVARGGTRVPLREAPLAHVEGFEQPGPGGVVIEVGASREIIRAGNHPRAAYSRARREPAAGSLHLPHLSVINPRPSRSCRAGRRCG
jgi:hypothetical protein